MIHYLLNTGAVHPELRSSTSPAALRSMATVYTPGRHPLPIQGYQAEIVRTRTGCFGLIMRQGAEQPSLSIAVAEDAVAARALWEGVVRWCAVVSESPGISTTLAPLVQPTTEPWYATLMMQVDRDEQIYLSDLCRHFAWGWIAYQRRRTTRRRTSAPLPLDPLLLPPRPPLTFNNRRCL